MTHIPRTTFTALAACCVLSGTAAAGTPASAGAPARAPEQAPPTTCAVEQLPLPGEADAGRVSGADPTGRILLGSAVVGQGPLDTDAVIWDGRPVSFDARGDVVDMNAEGVGVGHYLEDGTPHAWTYDGDEVRPLAGAVKARAINDSGRIVGERMAPTPNGPPIAIPVTWPSPSEQPVDLVPDTRNAGKAYDLTEDGTIVGTFEATAVLWRPDGSREPLPLPEGVPPEAAGDAVAISGPWVVGHVEVDRRPVRWNLDTGAVEFVDGVDEAFAVNDRGWVVGESGGRGVLSTGDSVVELPGLGPDYMSAPAGISPDGAVIGGTTQPRGNPSPVTEVPVRWNCS